MNERLQVNLLIPGAQLPPHERFIIAVVNDGQEEFRYKFGRNTSLKLVNEQIPKLYMDEMFDRNIRAKAA